MSTEQQAQQRLRELGDFLMTRRGRLSPTQVGLPSGGRRRTPGLRRTEVAQLAGVSVEWYTWLEQGRPITVSLQVLESLVQTLRLDTNEREYLFFLAHQQPPPDQAIVSSTVSPTLQHFLDQLENSPAYVTGEWWDIVGWNKAAHAVFGNFQRMTNQERNVVWRMFLSPTHRQMLVDWEGHAQHILAQFRASCGRFPGNPWMAEIRNDLMMNSPEFRAWWPNHEVLRIPEGEKVFNHPRVGCLEFEQITFQVYDTPELKVTTYIPVDNTETTAKIGHLLLSKR